MLDNYSNMKDQRVTAPAEPINTRIARQVAGLRAAAGLSLEALATRCDVSRSMISLIERGEASATAVVLEKLASGLGVPLALLFDAPRAVPGPLVRRAEQPEWRDPGSGYLRRNVSPPDHPSTMRIVEVQFPPGTRGVLEGASPVAAIEELVWMLDGAMLLTHRGIAHRLEAGDCLTLRLDGPIEFRNPTRRPARYAVVIAADSPRRAVTSPSLK